MAASASLCDDTSVEEGCFRLSPIEAICSSLDWFIAVLVVVAELEETSELHS